MYALAWGTLVGTVVELILLGLAMRAAGEPLALNFHFGDPYLRRVLALMVPITITLGILNFNALIDTYFAQYVSDHAAAEIGYSFRLYQLPQGIFAVTIGTILFPSLSRFAAQRNMDEFRETLSLGRAPDDLRLAAVPRLVHDPGGADRAAGLPARHVRRRRDAGGGVGAGGVHAGPDVRQRQHHVQPRASRACSGRGCRSTSGSSTSA